jgi:hypothetical protein
MLYDIGSRGNSGFVMGSVSTLNSDDVLDELMPAGSASPSTGTGSVAGKGIARNVGYESDAAIRANEADGNSTTDDGSDTREPAANDTEVSGTDSVVTPQNSAVQGEGASQENGEQFEPGGVGKQKELEEQPAQPVQQGPVDEPADLQQVVSDASVLAAVVGSARIQWKHEDESANADQPSTSRSGRKRIAW